LLEVDIRARLGAFGLDAAFASADAPVTALFGRSGAGKSSIISAVAGLLKPDAGRITLDGRVLFDSTARIAVPASQRRVGVVFQDMRLFPHLSVRANLLYGWRRRDNDATDASAPTVDTVVEPLGIGPLLDRRPATLSGGEKQRVAIGRAILANPRLLMMDEPLASLDGERKAELLPLLAELPRAFGIPIVYVSHAVDEVLRLADRMVLLDAGRVIAAGPVEDVANRADFARIAALEGGPDAFTVIAATIIEHDAAAQTRLSFPGGSLMVPRVAGEPGQRVRLRIAANEVMLALAPPTGLSVRNVIPARVTDIEDVGGLVEVMLDAGGPLRARISQAARIELGLVPGMAVFALIKSAALASRQPPLPLSAL
jgi:molybdate transport system ATP-binding protein